jgi:glycolate oxidase FAD binding subunit
VEVSPADLRQVSEVLQFANANSLAVTPAGAGTKQGWGHPVAAPIRLSLLRLRRCREHAWQDMTCTVEAGCSWADMQAELAKHGQMVALDPAWPEQATVGGIVAANDSGAWRLKYGGLRDLILGMTLVLADGVIARTGGKVVKNVAGYDLQKLIAGSFGTLGVIAEVNFRLHPVEEHSLGWTAAANEASALEGPLRALLASQLSLTSLQIRADARECALDLRIDGPPECLTEYAQRLRELFHGFAPLEVRESEPGVWKARQELFNRKAACVARVSVLPGQLCSLLAELRRREQADGVEIAAVAQATGLTTLALRGDPSAVIAALRGLRAVWSGGVVLLQPSDEVRAALDVWGCDAPALPLMREVKRRFDPNRVLNPGRFVGGI